MATAKALTPLQQRFVEEYALDLNATAAYKRAGYKGSEAAACANSARLIANDKVAAAIREAQKERADRTAVTADRVLAELARLGFSSVDHFVIDDEGRVGLAESAPPTAIQAVASIKRKVRHLGEGSKEYETEIRLWDKPGTLKTIAQHLGMLVNRQEVSGPGGTPMEARLTHEPGSLLAPYRDLILGLGRDLAGAPPPGVGDDGPGEPVDPAAADAAAGAVPHPPGP